MTFCCADCGRTDARVYVETDIGHWCRRCYVSWAGPRAGRLAKNCTKCAHVVDQAACEYVKSRNAYYCNLECKKEDAQCRRKRPQPGALTLKNSKTKSPKPTTGLPSSSLKSSLPTGCAIGTTENAPSDNYPANGNSATPSKSSPETSKTSVFDPDAASQCLRRHGLDLGEGPEPYRYDGDTWRVWTVGMMGRQPVGVRYVTKASKGWELVRNATKDTTVSLDPLGGF